MKHSDDCTKIAELKDKVRKFVKERRWEKYHNPKDLAESICIESAELLEIFQWVSPEEALSWKNVPSKLRDVKEELADIFIYCLSMANVMDMDVAETVIAKLRTNEEKYPADKFYGKLISNHKPVKYSSKL